VLEAEFVLDDAARGRLLSRFGEGAREWCAGLPRLVEQYCSRWDLQLEQAQSGSTSRVYFGWQREQPGQPCLGDPDFDAVDWVLAPGATQTPEQRIEELCGLVPGLDADRLEAWCRATAVIIVVQHLHNRPADARIPFLLQLAARA
jgi:hypothetical protein